ncbi:MAG: tetratricopeptide repeat protein [Acidobacteria bacterium]|nr:tetratricopeptide repeat protein [Acidobacteriota bacterium]
MLSSSPVRRCGERPRQSRRPSFTVGLLNRPRLKSVARASARAESQPNDLRYWAPCLLISLALLCSPSLLAQAKAQPASSFATLSANANAARDSHRLDEALVLYKKALALRPGWTEGWWGLGTIQYDRNAYLEAARSFERVIAQDSRAGTARVMLGLCEFQLGQDDSALKHIQQGNSLGIAANPELRRVMFYHEGVLLQRKGRFQGAQEALYSLCLDGIQTEQLTQTLGMVALRMRDKNPPAAGSPAAETVARVGQAECLAGQKKFDEARPLYSAVTRDYPEYPNIHYAHGRFLLEARDTAAGIDELKREITNNPNHVFARLQIAAAKYKTDSAAGLPYAEEAVKLDPRLPLGHYLLGLLLLDTDDYRRAIPELEIAQRAFPREAKVYLALGAAYSRAEQWPEAARARAAFARLSQESEKGSGPPNSGKESSGAVPGRIGVKMDAEPPR